MRDEYGFMRMATVLNAMKDRLSTWKTTKWALSAAMFKADASLVEVNGVWCLLKSVEREDGSGKKFNLVLHQDGQDYKCFATTTD